jgi:hypothetical protein
MKKKVRGFLADALAEKQRLRAQLPGWRRIWTETTDDVEKAVRTAYVRGGDASIGLRARWRLYDVLEDTG